jgi:hypothetical protein
MRFFAAIAVAVTVATAPVRGQVTLSAGTYVQDFNNIAAGLPPGWSVATSATVNTTGATATFTAAAISWTATGVGTDFRNVASDDIASGANSATQAADANRAIGWRPVGSSAAEVGPGRTGALGVNFAPTTGLILTALTVRVFTANDVAGSQTYQLEYRIGTNGNFLPIGSSYTTGPAFNAQTLVADPAVLHALSEEPASIFIRIRGTATSGASNLDTIGIDDFTLTVVALPTVTTAPVAQTGTVGGTISLSVVAATTGTTSYQWRRNAQNLNVPSATSPTLTLSNITRTADEGSYDVVITDSVGSVISTPATLTINKATAGITLGSLTATYDGHAHAVVTTTTPVNRGVSITYNGSVVPPTAAGSYAVIATVDDPEYQGSVAGTLVIAKATATVALGALAAIYDANAHAATATTAPPGLQVDLTYDAIRTAPTNAGTYAVVASVVDPNYQGSTTATLAIAQALQVISFAAPPDRVAGDAPFILSATASSGLPVSFAVMSGPASSGGTNGATLTLTGGVGRISVRATQAGNINYQPAVPVLRTFDVVSAPTMPVIVEAPSARIATVGDTVEFVVVTSGTAPFTYQWKRGATTVGANESTLTLRAISVADAGIYTVAVTNAAGSVSTGGAQLVVNRATQSITFPALSDRTAAAAPVNLTATSTSGLAVEFSIVSGPAVISGATLTLTGLIGQVVVRASQPGNANFVPAATIERSFLVSPAPTPPHFTLGLSAGTATVGDAFSFTCIAEGFPAPTYSWAKDGVMLPGETRNELVLSTLTIHDAGSYTVTARNSLGSVATSAELRINKKSQAITFAPAITSAPVGSAITLRATATSDLSVAYSLVSGTASLSGARLTGTSPAVVVRASQPGNTTFDAAAPVDRIFNFTTSGTAPFMSSAPIDQTVAAGATVTFLASAIGSPPPSFQWFRNEIALTGANSGTLVLGNVRPDDSAQYTVVATNAAGSAHASATLTVNAPPVIVVAPRDSTVFEGELATFTATATGAPAPSFQWRRNGVPVAYATAGTFTLSAAQITDAGTFDVVATNPFGTAVSRPATLIVQRHDYTGDYFGAFTAGAFPTPRLVSGLEAAADSGEFVLHVRSDGTAVLLGFVAATQTAFVARDVHVDRSGQLVGTLSPLSMRDTERQSVEFDSETPVMVRAALDDREGRLHGSIGTTGSEITGICASRTGASAAQAGVYEGTLIGNPPGPSCAIVASDGRGYAVLATESGFDAAMLVNINGHLTGSTAARATVDLSFTAGGLSGTITDRRGANAIALAREDLVGRERLANFSLRSGTGPGPRTLITGFVVAGAPKRLLIRAAGPALAAAPFNVTGVLPDPTLRIFRAGTLVAENNDWTEPAGGTVATAVERLGAFPFRLGSADAALVADFAPGAYTVLVTCNDGATEPSGIALAEIYEFLESDETPGTRRLKNLSARGVARSDEPLIAGFVIDGAAPHRLLIRAVGPTLALPPIGLTGTLADPQLTIYRGTTIVKSNDDWFRAPDAASMRDAAAKSGAFALGATSADAAAVLTLAPGAYTVHVTGSAGTIGAAASGIVLIEIYEAPW